MRIRVASLVSLNPREKEIYCQLPFCIFLPIIGAASSVIVTVFFSWNCCILSKSQEKGKQEAISRFWRSLTKANYYIEKQLVVIGDSEAVRRRSCRLTDEAEPIH